MNGSETVSGYCDPAFESVRQAFTENFSAGREVGAALSVSVGGRNVVDIWGGVASSDGQQAWERDTSVCLFSCSKGLISLMCLLLADRGMLDLDQPVSSMWPEFAANGKADLPFRYLLTHQAGLPAVRRQMPHGALTDWDAMTSELARTEPWWEPGKAHGYHGVTFGFLVGEALHRLTGKLPSALFEEVLAGPWRLDLGLRSTAQFSGRVADLVLAPVSRTFFDHWTPDGLGPKSFFNPPDCNDIAYTNTPGFREAEVPGANGFGTARALERAYVPLACGGCLDGKPMLSPALVAEAASIQVEGHDLVMELPTAFSLGFEYSIPEWRFGPSPYAFGHNGSGGSLGMADPASGVAVGYVMNRLWWGEVREDPRWEGIFAAIYGSL